MKRKANAVIFRDTLMTPSLAEAISIHITSLLQHYLNIRCGIDIPKKKWNIFYNSCNIRERHTVYSTCRSTDLQTWVTKFVVMSPHTRRQEQGAVRRLSLLCFNGRLPTTPLGVWCSSQHLNPRSTGKVLQDTGTAQRRKKNICTPWCSLPCHSVYGCTSMRRKGMTWRWRQIVREYLHVNRWYCASGSTEYAGVLCLCAKKNKFCEFLMPYFPY